MRGLLLFFFESLTVNNIVIAHRSLVFGLKANKNNKLTGFASRVISYQTINLRTNDQEQKSNDIFIKGKKKRG